MKVRLPQINPLAIWQGRHAQQDIIVCGCGPSLRELGDKPAAISIGVNDVGRLFDPDYLVVINPRSQFKADRWRAIEQSNARALFTQLDLGSVRPPVVRFKLGRYGGTDIRDDGTLHYTQNSPYVAVCLAALMGARRIGLIGVDFTEHHFFAATGRHPLARQLAVIDAQYGRLAQALSQRGIELVNLSPTSRLQSLPRRVLSGSDGWLDASTAMRAGDAFAPLTTSVPPRTSFTAAPLPPSRPAMKIAIERRSPGVLGDLMEALAGSAAQLGHRVSRDPRSVASDPNTLCVVWNGRGHRGRGPTLYCEHGWLPRAAYQISPRGINAGSHLAPFHWDGVPLAADADRALDSKLDAIRSATLATAPAAAAQTAEFLLVPLQMGFDTNLVHHAPAHLRTMQALVDQVSAANPPWPLIFKQHPADARRGNHHLRLKLRRRQDRLWPLTRGDIHALLRSAACRGVITINSNTAHDALLWDVPVIVLGRNLWPDGDAPHAPFLTRLPRDWRELAHHLAEPATRACRRAYAAYLIDKQWTLADARDPARVATLLASISASPAGAIAPRKPTSVLPMIRRDARPLINVVAENRGWLFETWKQAMVAAGGEQRRVTASERPLRAADAWIFIRSREAARSPDPARTLVQIHDLADAAAYAEHGERSAVRHCAAVSMTHPQQAEILQRAGLSTARQRWLMQPVGWRACVTSSRAPRDGKPVVGWVGRSSDRAALAWLCQMLQIAALPPLHLQLIGDGLALFANQLRALGIDCRTRSLAEAPLARCHEWIPGCDALLLTATEDAGPWPLFDAIACRVPVIARPHAWAEQLLADARHGRLAATPEAMHAALVAELGRERRDIEIALPAEWNRWNLRAWAEAQIDQALQLIDAQRAGALLTQPTAIAEPPRRARIGRQAPN